MEETPKCDKCGAEITTGLMAAFCPFKDACDLYAPGIEEFRPKDVPAVMEK